MDKEPKDMSSIFLLIMIACTLSFISYWVLQFLGLCKL